MKDTIHEPVHLPTTQTSIFDFSDDEPPEQVDRGWVWCKAAGAYVHVGE